MPRNIFELIDEKADELITVELSTLLDDGKPCAVKVRPLRWGDFMVLGGYIPVPAGRKPWKEWTAQERKDYVEWIREMLPYIVEQARDVTKAEVQVDGEPTKWKETWIPLSVCKPGETPVPGVKVTALQLENLGEASLRISNAVLYENDQGGDVQTLPAKVASEDFPVAAEGDGDVGVDGGDVRDPAA